MLSVDPQGKGWRFTGNEHTNLLEVLNNGFAAGADGSMNERLEALFAQTLGLPYAISFNSGTGTLHAVLHAFGIGPGDEVIVPALAPAMCGFTPLHAGATLVPAEVDRDTFLLDPADLERKITPRTKAIMAVHLYGQVCDMEAVMALAARHGLKVLEDCAQCFLGTDRLGRVGGTIGDAGSWSYENSKHLSSGEGGMVACRDAGLATEIRKFGGLGFRNLTASSGKVRVDRDKLQDPEWARHDRLGYNYRLGGLAAAVALAQTERMRHFVDLRIAMGETFRDVLARSALLRPQARPDGAVNSYYTFAARFDGLDQGIAWQDFRKVFMANGGDGIYAAWMPIHREPAFADTSAAGAVLPVTEALQKRIMQFTTNQRGAGERQVQIDALVRTLRHFGDAA
jgi:perosamine synthetase